jgi:signal transduction histidine kinase
MSIRARLTISFTALFGAIVIALAVAAYVVLSSDAYHRLDAALRVATGATAMSAEHELNEHHTQLAGEKDLQSVLDEAGTGALTDTQILVREGDRNAAYRPALHNGFDLRVLPPQMLRTGTVNGFRIVSGTVQVPKFNAVYRIYSARPISPALARVEQIRIVLLFVIPLGLGLAGLAGYLLARRSLRPLQELAKTVDKVTSSDLSTRVRVNGGDDEISTLGLRFNSLLDRLEQAFNVQRQFMADASHQIRTPVTVALAAAQVTSHNAKAELHECQDSLQIVEHQMLQLRKTVEDMLFLSQADTASLKIEPKEIYLDDAISDASRAAKMLARNKRQTVKIISLPEAECLGDPDLLKQAVLILLDNSVKFTPPGGIIEVALFEREKRWICSVTDNGPGISAIAQLRIFERFFRDNLAGQKGAAGAGLGLAIAKSIIEAHHGTLALVETRPGRTTFEIAIPAFERDASLTGVHPNSLPVRI